MKTEALKYMFMVMLLAAACTKPEDDLVKPDGGMSSGLSSVVPKDAVNDITEDIIPDFSRVGYHYGDDPVPYYSNIIATLYPSGDDTDRADDIQAALDAADGRTNSVVLLKAGDYYVSRQIELRKSHLVLRGEGGGVNDWKTRIIATGNAQMGNCIRIGNGPKTPVLHVLSSTEISESYVPVGRMSLCVRDASHFDRGDRVVLYRPSTVEWIHDIRMDQISDGEYWDPGNMHMNFERTVTKVTGNRIYLDAPTVMAFDKDYGGGYVLKSSMERVHECGVEDIFVESTYDPSVLEEYSKYSNTYAGGMVPADEDHCKNGVKFTSCEHCWAKGISGRHFVFSLVGMGGGSKNVTVEDCHSREPVSLIQGSRRYAFAISSTATMGLFIGCSADKDRHSFVPVSSVPGPNVFLDCEATNCFNETGPHCFWSAGILYDCLKQDSNRISIQDSDFNGTGASHGWQGTCVVLWNCEAPKIVCQSPWTAEGKHPTGRNYVIGCIGEKTLSTVKHFVTKEYLNDRPQAEWVPDPGAGGSNTEHVTSGTYYGATADGLSLYRAQLAARKAKGARVIPADWYN